MFCILYIALHIQLKTATREAHSLYVCRTNFDVERVPGCCSFAAVLADGVACLHPAQAEPWLGSCCSCCAGCFGFHGRNHASWGLEGPACWHRPVHQAFDLLDLPTVRPSLLGVPALQLPLGLGLLRGSGHRHQPDPAWDSARWGPPSGIGLATWRPRFSNLHTPQFSAREGKKTWCIWCGERVNSKTVAFDFHQFVYMFQRDWNHYRSIGTDWGGFFARKLCFNKSLDMCHGLSFCRFTLQ